MKSSYKIKQLLQAPLLVIPLLLACQSMFAQDSTIVQEKAAPVKKFVKNTFESIWIIDNQTIEVPVKGTFEMDIMHRFGTLQRGYKDFYGFFAPSNIRLGFSYVPVKNLLAGVSITKTNLTWEGYAKYAILKQTKGKENPLSVTYYANMAVETRTKENYTHFSDRISYFHQILVARKINDKISIQLAPSLTHVNFVYGQFVDTTVDKTGRIQDRSHNHYAIALSARYKIKEGMGIIFNYDQPLTSWKIGNWYPFGQHKSGNPSPNLSIGLEMTTSAHAFQVFFSNYYFITPQRNNYSNGNNPVTIKSFNDITFHKEKFLIGFNITRLWNY